LRRTVAIWLKELIDGFEVTLNQLKLKKLKNLSRRDHGDATVPSSVHLKSVAFWNKKTFVVPCYGNISLANVAVMHAY